MATFQAFMVGVPRTCCPDLANFQSGRVYRLLQKAYSVALNDIPALFHYLRDRLTASTTSLRQDMHVVLKPPAGNRS